MLQKILRLFFSSKKLLFKNEFLNLKIKNEVYEKMALFYKNAYHKTKGNQRFGESIKIAKRA